MSLCFLHAQESSVLVTRCESSHLLELQQLQAGGGALGAVLSPCLSVRLLWEWGEHAALPILQVPCDSKKLKDPCKSPPAPGQWAGAGPEEKPPVAAWGWGWARGMRSISNSASTASAKLTSALKASDKAGELVWKPAELSSGSSDMLISSNID